MVSPQIFVIAGPNGAGKTTIANTILLDYLQCYEYINADIIALGLSSFKQEEVAIQAGRLALKRIEYLASRKLNFAFETTLSGKTYLSYLRKYKNHGYIINIIFLWLSSHDLAIKRVETRVKKGGHNISQDIIIRRYHRGIYNFIGYYIDIADNWFLYDNSYKDTPILIAKKEKTYPLEILEHTTWQKINNGARNETIYK